MIEHDHVHHYSILTLLAAVVTNGRDRSIYKNNEGLQTFPLILPSILPLIATHARLLLFLFHLPFSDKLSF